MKKSLIFALVAGCAMSCFAAEYIYRGTSKKAEDMVCCYMGGRFFADAARKQQIYHHPGNMVSKEAKATRANCIYMIMGDRLYKGASSDKKDCIATILETKKNNRGETLSATVFEGFVVVRDQKWSEDKKAKTQTLTGYKVTADGVNKIQPKVLFTIANNKIFRGSSGNDKDCLLNYTGKFNTSRLIFIAVERAK